MFPEIRRRDLAPDIDLPGILPVLRRIYASRGIRSATELAYDLQSLPCFERLAGLGRAVELLAEAIVDGGRIVVVGDYDADGATSCAVAVRALRGLGAAEVHARVPNRFVDGYGLTPSIVESVAALEPVLLMTVDNGVASVEGVAAARTRGIRVLVTDHHLPGPVLPAADALVDPNQPGDDSGLGYLAGVGVTFLVMVALRSALRQRGWFAERSIEEPNLGDLLDLVALGTVADVVPLEHGNRLLVHQGLRRLRGGRCQPGLRALAETAGRRLERLTEVDLGFVLGPRLNAAGRLADMSLGIRCLLAGTLDEALEPARQLDRLNRERRAIEARMEAEAVEAVERLSLETADDLPAGLCLFDEAWHQGVVGIVASRLKDRWHRPVIAFAPGDDGELRGSARSVAAVHVRDAIERVANLHPGMVSRFGGHAMAAGLTLARERLKGFEAAFASEVDRLLPFGERRGIVHTDGELEPDDLDLDLARQIRTGGPWGTAFPEPVFDGRFEVVERRRVGGGRHLRMKVRPVGGRLSEAVAFRTSDEDWPPGAVQVDMVYRLEVDYYQGLERPQLLVTHLRVV